MDKLKTSPIHPYLKGFLLNLWWFTLDEGLLEAKDCKCHLNVMISQHEESQLSNGGSRLGITSNT